MRTIYRIRIRPEAPAGRFYPWVHRMELFCPTGEEFDALRVVHPGGDVTYQIVGDTLAADLLVNELDVEVLSSAVEFEGSGDHVDVQYTFEACKVGLG